MADDAITVLEEADSAAARGDLARARALLSAIESAGEADAQILLKLAALHRGAGDRAAALRTVEAALALVPLDFTTLMMRAHLLESIADTRADEAYAAALAQRPDGALPPALQMMVDHASARRDRWRDGEERRMAVAADPITNATADERDRFARFRGNAVRRTRAYHSEPTDFHYPGLREREFHDRADFRWLATLEAATDAIAGEFRTVLAAERAQIVPYVQYEEHRPLQQWRALNHSSDWSSIHLLRNGERIDDNARHCPNTMALLAGLPQPAIGAASPNAMFSLLAPGARIPPHTGVANTRLVCHLPLIVPPGCWFRVGAQTRSWRRGEAWVFDDTIEHEAANESDALRVVFIFDLWHIDLTPAERDGVAAMIGAHAGGGAL